MTALIMQATPFVEMVVPTLRRIFSKLSDALDEYATYKMQRAVPESELRRAEREIKRYRRLMREGAARQVRAKSTAASSHHTAPSMRSR